MNVATNVCVSVHSVIKSGAIGGGSDCDGGGGGGGDDSGGEGK